MEQVMEATKGRACLVHTQFCYMVGLKLLHYALIPQYLAAAQARQLDL